MTLPVLPSFSDSPTCNRCGRCCYYEIDGVWRKCRNLVEHVPGKRSSCRIWPNNVRTIIDRKRDGTPIICHRIESLNVSYFGCPYNVGKPLVRVPVRPFFD